MSVARQPISAFIVTFNEEERIARCLRSVSFCDEVVVVDSFSTDRTVAIATELGARVLQRRWSGYVDQKSYGLAQVSHEWVLNLDADEELSEELRESILQVLAEDPPGPAVGYYLNRVVFYLGRWWDRGGWYPEYRLRLFRKSCVTWGGVEPHEKVMTEGRTGRLRGPLYHYTFRSLREHLQKLDSFSSIAAQQEFRSRRRISLPALILKPMLRSFKFFVLKRGYREGSAGFVVALIEGYYTFLKYAKLWELYDEERRSGGEGESRRT